MKDRLFLLALAPLLLALPDDRAEAWGPQAHTVIGQSAAARASPRTRAGLHDILDVDSAAELDSAIADACFWPDTIRDEPGWAWSAPLHYVNLPRDAARYDRARDCPDDLCVTEGVRRYAADLAGPDGTGRWQAFAWLCHLVADLHQPLHAGFGDDRGGNRVQVEYRGERLNLHRFWDSVLPAERLAADGAWLLGAAGLPDTRGGTAAWDPADVAAWTGESHALAHAAYPPETRISDAFADASWEIIRGQWSKASARLALILDHALGGSTPQAGGAGRRPPGMAQRSRATRNPIRASWRSGSAEIRNAERDWSGELAQ